MQGTLPNDIPHFSGSYADLLIVVLHKMIVTGEAEHRLLTSASWHCVLILLSCRG
jgi:hypothetical protein